MNGSLMIAHIGISSRSKSKLDLFRYFNLYSAFDMILPFKDTLGLEPASCISKSRAYGRQCALTYIRYSRDHYSLLLTITAVIKICEIDWKYLAVCYLPQQVMKLNY